MRSRPVALALAFVPLVLGALTLARSSAQDPKPAPRKPAGLAGAGLTPEQVNAAVERGKQFLLKAIGKNWDKPHAWNGDEVLMATALAHTNAYARDPGLARKAIVGLYAPRDGETYPTALTIMALEQLGGDRHHAKLIEAAQHLVDERGAKPDQGWSYGKAQPSTLTPPPAEVPDPTIIVRGGTPIASAMAPTMLGLGATGVNNVGDNSCSQFALLGLHSAATLGISPPQALWDQAIDYFAKGQKADGGWAYKQNDKAPYLSMTCAGVTGLAIALGHEGKPPLADARVQHGLEWLGTNWTLEPGKASRDKGFHYYAVYGLERVGVLLGVDFIGEHEWYPEGAKWLLSQQQPDGSWNGGGGKTRDTCFALFFLSRATTPLAVPQGGQGTLRTAVVTEPSRGPTGLLFILDASDSMNDKIKGRSKWEIVKEAAKKIVAALPDDAPVGLRVYGHNPSDPHKVGENETELLMPVGKLDRDKFSKIVDGITPKGRTPIAMSFDRCNNDLRAAPPCRVLLLSDGAETGGGDPVASARNLALNPKCIAIDCLGFDIATDPKAREQLMEIALTGRGRFTESIDPDVLATAGARAPEAYTVLDSKGAEVAKGRLGDTRSLAEGEYRFRVTIAGTAHERSFWVNTGAETDVTVDPAAAKK